MNTLLRCCTLGAMAAGLAACASHGTMRQPAATTATAATGPEMDAEYVQLVEYFARRRGVDVRWVNPPTKRLASADADSPE